MNLIKRAQHLRSNTTDAENKLWSRIKREQLGVKFRRQQPIGPYIVDFFCPSLKLIIEADGGQHNPEIDGARDQFLRKEGYKIRRYWNNEIMGNIDGVMLDTMENIQFLSPPPAHASPIGLRRATSPLKGEVESADKCR